MSSTRGIWNDGAGLTTPDLQRPSDAAAAADDRAHEIYITPGSVQKKLIPMFEESTTTNPRLLVIPSGTNGAVRVQPFSFVAGSGSSAQQISLVGTTYAGIDTGLLGSNISGSNRYDLVYATLTRQVTVSAARRIKSAVDGSVSSQTINLADAPTITINVIAGFLTGGTPPTTGQIASALPADTATSFNVALCYVTVATAYSSGTAIAQSAISPVWPGGWVAQHRIRGLRPMSFYTSAIVEKPTSPVLANSYVTTTADRWGATPAFFGHPVIFSSTIATPSQGHILDNQIDWRKRLVWGFVSYIGSGALLPLETQVNPSGSNGFVIGPIFTGFTAGSFAAFSSITYSGSNVVSFQVDTATGALCIARGASTPINGASGDLLSVILFCTDQFTTGV